MSPWRRHRTDLALAVVALLAVALVLVDRGSVTTAEAEDRQYQIIDAWRPDDISRVEIRIGERQVVFEAIDDPSSASSWTLVEAGETVEADDQAIGQLLVSLEFAAFDHRVEGLERAAMGLETPRASYRISMGALSYEVRLGKEAPSPEGGAYVEVEGGARGREHYVVGPELVGELMIEPGQLRSHRLAPYLSIEVGAYELDQPGVDFRLARGDWGGRTAGQFLVEGGTSRPLRADRRAVDGWLTVLGRLEAERFVPLPDPAAAGTAKLTFAPLSDDDPQGELVLGIDGPCEGEQTLVVRRAPEPAAGCVPKEALEPILVDPARLRDRHVVGSAKGDITEIRWRSGEATVEIARKETGWHMREPTEGEAEREPVEQLIDMMLEAEGEIVAEPDPAALGLAEPRATVQIRALPERGVAAADERVERIEVGNRTEEGVYLRRVDDGAVLRVAVEPARAFLPRPAALRSTQLFDAELKDVVGLALDCDGKRQRMTRLPAGAWTLEAPDAPIGADMGLANALADNFRQLEAVRWVSERPEKGHGLAEPWCRVTLVVRGGDRGERELTVRLGTETTGGYFAQRGDEPSVFVAPKGLGQIAEQWLLDTGALMFDTSKLEKVTLAAGDRERSVARQGATWTAPRLGATVTKVLGELVAEGIVDLGPPPEGSGFDEPLLRIVARTGPDTERALLVGRGEVYRNVSVYLVREEGKNVTFAVARTRLDPLIEAL